MPPASYPAGALSPSPVGLTYPQSSPHTLYDSSKRLTDKKQETPSLQRPSTPSYMSELRGIESPVLDLASTLMSQAEDEVDADNVSFLRAQPDPQEDWSAQNAADEMQGLSRNSWGTRPDGLHNDLRLLELRNRGIQNRQRLEEARRTQSLDTRQTDQERRDNLQRMLDQDRRQADQERRDILQRMLDRLSRGEPAYSDRIPNQQSLYDWAPGHDDDNLDELQEILEQLRRHQPNTHPDVLRVLGTSQLDSHRQQRELTSSMRSSDPSQPTRSSESSLRSAAILQSVRRHPRFSARTRDHMQRYVLERERTVHEGEERDRSSPSQRQRESLSAAWSNSRYELNRLAWQSQQRPSSDSQSISARDARARVDAYRRGYLENPFSSLSIQQSSHRPSSWLEATIRYLSSIRFSKSYDEALSHAIDANFVTKEFFGDDHENFLLDVADISAPPETSWLFPGTTFSGRQNAHHVISPAPVTTTYRLPNNQSITSTTFDARRPWVNHESQTPHTISSSLPHPNPMPTLGAGESNRGPDHWPVRVTLHSVDYEKMTLSGTMEAFDIPSPSDFHSSIYSRHHTQGIVIPDGKQGITTYLEGEIIDFNRFTLLTESFKSCVGTDAMYWRKLEPFQSFASDDDLVRHLVSKRWLEEVLFRNYVLMRWKEKCFVGSSRRGSGGQRTVGEGCGLTISGFYYVSLRRADGKVEGLYFDDSSTLYQRLSLDVERGRGFPKWEFR